MPVEAQNAPPPQAVINQVADKDGALPAAALAAVKAHLLDDNSSNYSEDQLLFMLGLSLLLGFVFMLLVDQLVGSHNHRGAPSPLGELVIAEVTVSDRGCYCCRHRGQTEEEPHSYYWTCGTCCR